MSYTDAEWENVMSFLNTEAERPPPDGIGKVIETPEEFVEMLHTTEAIKPLIVGAQDARDRREFGELQKQKAHLDRAVIDTQDQIDTHPGNPNRP